MTACRRSSTAGLPRPTAIRSRSTSDRGPDDAVHVRSLRRGGASSSTSGSAVAATSGRARRRPIPGSRRRRSAPRARSGDSSRPSWENHGGDCESHHPASAVGDPRDAARRDRRRAAERRPIIDASTPERFEHRTARTVRRPGDRERSTARRELLAARPERSPRDAVELPRPGRDPHVHALAVPRRLPADGRADQGGAQRPTARRPRDPGDRRQRRPGAGHARPSRQVPPTQFTPVPRAKIAYLAASFRHINACARGEIPDSCGTTAVPNPRFPALALFGRRPSECVERPSSRQPKTYTKGDVSLLV